MAFRGWQGRPVVLAYFGGLGVGEKKMPAFVSFEGRQRQQGFISFQSPELPGAFEAGLVLPRRGFNYSGADRFSPGFCLLVIHPLMMSGEAADFFIQSFLLGCRQGLGTQAQLLQVMQHIQSAIVTPVQETEQRLEPRSGLLGALSVKRASQLMQMFLHMEEIDSLLGVLEAVLSQIPYPDGSVSDDEDLLGMEQSA